MVAISVARLTVADSTPSVWRRKRSMRLTHEAQVIPSMGSWTSVVPVVPVALLILPGSISRGLPRSGFGTLADMVAALVLKTLEGLDGPFHVAVSGAGVVAAES